MTNHPLGENMQENSEKIWNKVIISTGAET